MFFKSIKTGFFTMLFNGGLVPFYLLVSQWLGLKNNLLALVIPYLVNAWFVLLMKGYLQSVPESIIESAKIDGASELRIFIGIVLPISKPALATVGLFLVLQYWNDWWLPMLFVSEKPELFNLQYLLMSMIQNAQYLNTIVSQMLSGTSQIFESVPTLTVKFAMCILATGPMLFVFMFFQKYFVQGLTVGSVKG